MGYPDGVAFWWIDEAAQKSAPEFHQATLAWVRTLGLDPERLAPKAAVCRWQGGYELHVDEILRDPVRGYDRADPMNQDDLLTVRRIVPVAPHSWPAMPVLAAA